MVIEEQGLPPGVVNTQLAHSTTEARLKETKLS